jgi:hypothetical protein
LKKIDVTYIEPGGIIWKVDTDEEGKLLVAECRDAARRKTSLCTIELSTQKVLYHQNQLPQPWWIALKAVKHGKVILQGYKESNTPDPKGVYVMDLYKGKLLWQDPEKLFYTFADAETMLVLNQDSEWQKLNSGTGQLLETAAEPFATSIVDSERTGAVYPLLYTEDNAHYKTIHDFIREYCGYTAVGPVEYLEHEGRIMLSLYYPTAPKQLTNVLIVMAEDETILLKETLSEASEGVGMASFFINKNNLIYIKNKTSIALARL